VTQRGLELRPPEVFPVVIRHTEGMVCSGGLMTQGWFAARETVAELRWGDEGVQ